MFQFTYPYLEELAKNDVDFEGQILDYAARINTDIKQKLIDDRSLTWLNAKERVRQLVDAWIATELNEGLPG